MSNNNQQQLGEQQYHDRELLVRIFVLFRLLISSALLALTVLPEFSSLLHIKPQPWFLLSAAFYTATAVFTAVIVFNHLTTLESSTRLMLWSDILLLPLIMINVGDFATSIGMLLALSFLLGSLPLQQGYAVRALMAAILLLTAFGISQHFSTGANLNLRNSLSMGFAYLMIGYLSLRLARYLRFTEKTLLQQHVKLTNQVDVNTFIIQQLDSGAVVVDHEHRILYGNEAAWKMLGERPQKNDSLLSSISVELDTLLQQWQSTMTKSSLTSSLIHLQQEIAVRFTAFGSNSQQGALIALEDQKEVNRQAQQLKMASLGKLTAGVAHEIRNPLSAIHQAAQLLEESSRHDPQQMRLLEIIQTNTRRMNRQVEEILQLSRRSPNSESIQLNQWLPVLIDEYRNSSLSEVNQLNLQLPDSPCCINFDSEQLRQVLVNIISNAQQHSITAEGELIIDISVACSDAVNTTIDVSDNGEAIGQEQIGQLFDPFYTTSNSGAGLGLYLSRELCLNNNVDLEFIPMENSNIFRISAMPDTPRSLN